MWLMHYDLQVISRARLFGCGHLILSFIGLSVAWLSVIREIREAYRPLFPTNYHVRRSLLSFLR